MGSRTSFFLLMQRRGVLDPVLERGSSAAPFCSSDRSRGSGVCVAPVTWQRIGLDSLYSENNVGIGSASKSRWEILVQIDPFGLRRMMQKEDCVFDCPIRMLPLFC